MTSIRKALLFGFLIWLLPFIVAVLIFPLREANRPLFESIMPVVLSATVVVFGLRYLRTVAGTTAREGLAVGVLWLVISIAIDTPLMLFGGPMHMTLAGYVSDIAVTYFMIPIITGGLGVTFVRRGASPGFGGA